MKSKGEQKFFIQEHRLRENLFHGGIGNKHIEEILLKNGYEALNFPFQFDFSFKAKLQRSLFLLRILYTLPTDSTIVFQWPLYARIHVLLVSLLKRFRPGVRIICFLTDINGLKDGNAFLLKKEVNWFRQLDYFIVHNEAMQKWLLTQHPSAKISALQFFDFLAKPNSEKRKKEPTVAFAGYLDKSRFVGELGKLLDLHFYLYGQADRLVLGKAENVRYAGIIAPERLPLVIKGSFGLVWDGDGITDLEGVFGDYNRYISPHKLSLYILSGLPVIAHNDSGAAALVHHYQIGFTVNALSEIHQSIALISEDQYSEMQTNCFRLATTISKGECLLAALRQFMPTSSS